MKWQHLTIFVEASSAPLAPSLLLASTCNLATTLKVLQQRHTVVHDETSPGWDQKKHAGQAFG